MGSRGPRILAYSHDGYGLGHLRRNFRLLSAFGARWPDARIMLATGARSAESIIGHQVDRVQLPTVEKVANGCYSPTDVETTFESVLARRRQLLTETVREFRPDLLLVDRYPRGMHDELAEALTAHRRFGGLAVLGLRDILDAPNVVISEWHAQHYNQAIVECYDTVFCYGDQTVYDPIGEYQLSPPVRNRLQFTGYLADQVTTLAALNVRQSYRNERQLAVCTLGGGKDAAHVARSFVDAMRTLGRNGWTGVLITGPYMTKPDVDQFSGNDVVRVIRMVRDVPSYLAAADVVVCMGGYNTLCEVLAVRVPAVVIPRIQPRTEQLMRAQLFAQRGLLSYLHPNQLNAGTLAQAIDTAATTDRDQLARNVQGISHRGVNNTAQYLADLVHQRAAYQDAKRTTPRTIGVAG